MTRSSELLRGTLDLLILRALMFGPESGGGISRRLHQLSGGTISIVGGSLYPALHRLERRGLVTTHWQSSDEFRRSKAYTLTAVGRANVVKETERWSSFVNSAASVLGVRASDGKEHAPEDNGHTQNKLHEPKLSITESTLGRSRPKN